LADVSNIVPLKEDGQMAARMLGRSLSPANGVDAASPRVFGHPDAGYEARLRLVKLRDRLAAATSISLSRWKVPELFFSDKRREAERRANTTLTSKDPFAPLSEEIAAELPSLCSSPDVRRAARAIEGLGDAARTLAPKCEAARDLADLLAVPDDEAVLALDPDAGLGLRLTVRGIADVGQFHVLLAAAVAEESVGVGPQEPVPSRLVHACRNSGPPTPAGVPMVMEARFQMYTPEALRPDGTLPTGFGGCGAWLWPATGLSAVPRVDGVRVILLGPPAYAAKWDVVTRFPAMPAELNVVEVMSPFRVAEELSRLTGHTISPATPRPRALEKPLARAA
jgi:hypothetical protein